MAQNTNIVVITGNLTRDPELRHTQSGTAVLEMGVAVNDRVKRNGEWTDAAYFFDVTVWGNAAETCAQYLAKGRKVAVTGKLTWEQWEAKDGSGKRSKVRIVAERVEFLTPKGDSNGSTYGGDVDYSHGGGDGGGGGESFADSGGESFVPSATADDDIPF